MVRALVKALGGLYIIVGLSTLVHSAIVLVPTFPYMLTEAGYNLFDMGPIVFYPPAAVVSTATGYGLLTFKRWGRYVAILINSLSLAALVAVLAILSYIFSLSFWAIFLTSWPVAFSAASIFLLFTKDAKMLFRRAGSQDGAQGDRQAP